MESLHEKLKIQSRHHVMVSFVFNGARQNIVNQNFHLFHQECVHIPNDSWVRQLSRMRFSEHLSFTTREFNNPFLWYISFLLFSFIFPVLYAYIIKRL